MEKDKIKWLFFDIGSTLVDESACKDYRIRHLAAQPGAPSTAEISEMLQKCVRQLLPPYKTVAKQLGVKPTEWPSHMERLYPGVPQLLESLRSRYRLGIIANQNPGAETRLSEFGIRQYFDVIAASGDEGIAKPDPEIFLRALKRAGSRPGESIMIGDRPGNDIIPASALGMHTIWVRQGMYADVLPGEISFRADITANSITEINKHL